MYAMGNAILKRWLWVAQMRNPAADMVEKAAHLLNLLLVLVILLSCHLVENLRLSPGSFVDAS